MKNLLTGKNNKPLMGRFAPLIILGLITANSLFATTPSFARSTTNTTSIQNTFKTFCHVYYYDGNDVDTQAADTKNCKGRSAAFSQFMASIYTGTAWPKTSLHGLADKDKLKDTNDSDNLIKTRDDLQTAIDNFGNQPLSDLINPNTDPDFLTTLWDLVANDLKNNPVNNPPTDNSSRCANATTLPCKLTSTDLDQYCNDTNHTGFNTDSDTFNPKNAKCTDSQKTPITTSGTGLTFTKACRDVVTQINTDPTSIKGEVSGSSVSCVDNSSTVESTVTHPNKTVTFNQFKAIVEGFCQQFKTDVSNRLQPAESQGQQGHVDDLDLILDGSTSVSAVFTKDFYDQNPQNEDPEGEFFTSLDDVVQQFETVEIKDNASDFSTYDPGACHMYHTNGATAPSDSEIAKQEFDSYDYNSLDNGNIDSIVTDTVRATQDSAP